jgi:hypothetical protein
VICIRIFDTRAEAEWGRKVLFGGGISAKITEDNFYGVPIQKFGVRARYRLWVDDGDYLKSAKFLAKKLRKKD